MAVSTVKLNGTTLMTVNDTTATEADVINKYFYKADGTKVLGTASGGGGGDVDAPIFSDVWDDSWETQLSMSCNKTYAECFALYASGNYCALYVSKNESDTEEYSDVLILMSGGGSELVYSAFSMTTPRLDIHYSSNGELSVVSPSAFTETLNITQNGTYYPSGNAITEVNVNVLTPTPTLVTKSITANGTYNASGDNADGYSSVIVNVSGGGGASNFVTGSFVGTTAGAALEVSIPYTGNGYPISILVFPTEGPYNQDSGSFYSLIQRYAIASFYMVKNQTDTTPDYSSSEICNTGTGGYRYKSSTSSSITYSQGGFGGLTNSMRYMDRSASSGSGTFLYLRAKDRMSVYIASNDNYGFAPNIVYTYQIVYSS